ncbi:MAG: MBL fold metallo-hydrolase [Acidimicrobiales bacterium]
MRVNFLGVRGSTPAPGEEFVRYGGHTSCVAIAHDGEVPSLLLDAGTGIRRTSSLMRGEPFRGSILLSHLHWDHVHGLPFCDATDRNDSRVTLFVPDQLDGSDPLEMLSRGMSPPHFPVRADELRGDWSFVSLSASSLEIEGFTVLVEEIPHKGGRTYGFRVSDGTATVTYMPDHCPSALGPGPDGLGEYHPAALSLCQDADVLIHDAQLLREELEAEAYFGHAASEYAVELARRASVAQVVLFHHKQSRTDDELDELAKRFDGLSNVTLATQRTVLEL